MKNNIVIDIRMLKNSGISNYIQNIVPNVVNHFKNTNFIILTAPDSDNKYIINKFHSNNYKILKINSQVYSFFEQIEIVLKLKFYKINLYWAPNYNIPIFLNANFLITVHDLWHLIDKSWKRFYRRLYSKIMFFVISKKNSSIIAVSNFTKNEIISNTKIKNNISVIKHGIEKHWISTKSFKKNKDILFVGNIRNHKNIKLLIDTFINMNLKSISLILIGKNNNYLDETKYKYDNIKFIKEINRKKLIDYYNEARLLILPSKYEGFGFTPLEAMSCECPVLLSDIEPLKEICGNGAYYFDLKNSKDLENKILVLMNNESLCDELIANGKLNIKKYSWEKTSNETIKKIDKLLVS